MLLKLFHQIVEHAPIGVTKFIFNRWRPFWGACIHIDRIAPDFRTVEVSLKLRWYNQNYVGVHFGGSIFVITDAFYMLMLARNLGKNYIVWDKAARIEYKKPGRGTIKAKLTLSRTGISEMR